MNKGLVVAAGVVLAAAGAVGYQQFQYQQHVEAAVQGLVEQVKGTEIEGVPIHAVYDQHQGGVFQSTGRVSLIVGRSANENRMELDYVVRHHLDTLLSGMNYQIEARNSVFDGSTEETLTNKLFNGKPVLMNGEVRVGMANGTVLIPEIWLADKRDTIEGAPGKITWQAAVSPDGNFSHQLSGTYSYPRFEIKRQKSSKPGGLKVDGIQGEFGYDMTGDNNRSHMSAGFQALNFFDRDDQFRLGKTALRSAWEVSQFGKSQLNFSVLDAFVDGNDIPKIALNLSLDKLNAAAVRTIQQTIERAEQERWDADRAQLELYGIMLQLSDQLIQDDPVLAVDDLQVELGEKGSFVLDGSIMLDHAKLSPTALRDLMSAGRVSRQFQNELRHALNINVHVKADGQAQEVAYAALQRKARPLADALMDGDLVITAENGVLTIDGAPL